MDQKGILSVDLLLATLIFLIVIGSIVGFVSQTVDVAESSDVAQAQALSDTIARSINSVYTDGDGSYIIITFPDNFGDDDYVVDISDSTVTVNYKNRNFTANIIPETVSGTLTPGTNKISNNNNVITITLII